MKIKENVPMKSFDDFGFDNEPKNENKETKYYDDFTEVVKEIVNALENALSPYKNRMLKEFDSLGRNNERWKENHDGEDCRAFLEKQWALAAPFNAIKTYKKLYINRNRN